MPSMLPYIGIYLFCGLGIAIIIGHEFHSRDEEQQVFEELYLEHREACEQQSTAQVDDFFAVVEDIRAECLEAEVGSVEDGLSTRIHSLRLRDECERIFALEAREPGVRR